MVETHKIDGALKNDQVDLPTHLPTEESQSVQRADLNRDGKGSLRYWLQGHSYLAGWIEAVGVIVVLLMGLSQIRDTRVAIEAANEANRIALRLNAHALHIEINKLAIENPELAGKHQGIQRLHLIRLDYFYRIYDLHKGAILEADRFLAETEYLRWTAQQDEFFVVWDTFREQYATDFRTWVDETIMPYRPKAEPQTISSE